MAKKETTKKNKTSFKLGDKAAEKWTEEESIKVFEAILMEARKESCDWYSMQEVVLKNHTLVPHRTFYYLLEKFPILQSYKKEINDIIISRVSKGALLGDFVPAPAIWRMKMLGERETTEVINTNINTNVEPTDEQKQEAIERVLKGKNEFKDYE